MSLAVKISRKSGGRSDVVASRSWPQSRITIGRGDECTLVLDDPKKHVSRVHVELEETTDGLFGVTVVSKVNPIFIDGKRQAPGSRSELNAGDRFELGDYEIELLAPPPAPKVAAVVAEAEETTRPNSPAPRTPPAPAPQHAAPDTDDHADLHKAISAGDLPPVEAGFFDEPEAAPAPAPAPKAESAPAAAPKAAPAPTVAPKAAPAAAPKAPAPAPANVFDEATYVGKVAAPPAPAEAKKPAAPAPAQPAANVFDEATYMGGSAAPRGNLYDEATYVGGRPPPQATAPLGAPVPKGVPGADTQRLLRAFLESAGLDGLQVTDAEAEEFMRRSGAIVRAAVEGAMALLVARATAKKELRAEERTMVASKDNNPLKLMSDPQEAMSFLFDLKERTGGFLTPVQAVGDAFEDLRIHEVALIAGMRAALLGTIQRFDPKTLEAELEKAAGGLGLNRKAKLWELFSAYQEKLARDAGDDFNKVFGREFMGTYMAQVKRLRGGQ